MSRRSQRAQSAWNVPTLSPLARSEPTSPSRRSRSSRAALLVKVTARTLYGYSFSTVSSRYATRWTMTRVLPEPGPARMSSGPSTCETAVRWCGLRPSSRCSARAVEFFPGASIDPALEETSVTRASLSHGPLGQGRIGRATVVRFLRKVGPSPDRICAPRRRFRNLDPYWKSVAKILQMRNDQDLLELRLDRLNRLDDAVTAFLILGAEAFIYDQRLQPRAGPVGKQP